MRIRLFPASSMYTLPLASTTTPMGPESSASAAAPPSPLNPAIPFPATRDNCPLVSNRTTTEYVVSAMNTFPAPSTARPSRFDKLVGDLRRWGALLTHYEGAPFQSRL